MAALSVALAASVVASLWGQWMTDPSLSHGPLVPLISGALLWQQRERLRRWNAADGGGFALLAVSGLLYVAASWADIEFLKPLSLIGAALGIFWFLGGWDVLKAAAGPLGFLVFMIPWPTTLVDKIGFPLQLLSSAYAALFAGICGIQVQRDGIQLAVMPETGSHPRYQMVVAQGCSGLTSLLVLLALAYLIAYHTEVGIGWRAALFASVVPLALLNNAVRLTIILLVGAHNAKAAEWVHNHEAPALVFLCSVGLLSARYLLLTWLRSAKRERGGATRATDAFATVGGAGDAAP